MSSVNSSVVKWFSKKKEKSVRQVLSSRYLPPDWTKTTCFQIPQFRFPLMRPPTPIQSWNFLHRQNGVWKEENLWIKRDDLSEFLLSGNKIRKLEFLIAEILQKDYDSIITIGGINSNHCRAVAVAGSLVGLETFLILRVGSVEEKLELDGNVLIDHLVGANIRLVSRKDYATFGQFKLLKLLEDKLIKQGRKPFVMPVGGSIPIGSWGYIQAVDEIKQQMDRGEVAEVDDIVFACGSGGTATGLSVGIKLSGLKCKLTGISVCDNAEYFHKHVNEELQTISPTLKSEEILNINDNYKGIGYGLTTKEELELMKDVSQTSGIILDPTYTLKAVKAIVSDPAFKNRRILFIHTGGAFSTFSHSDQMKDLNLFDPEQVKPLFD